MKIVFLLKNILKKKKRHIIFYVATYTNFKKECDTWIAQNLKSIGMSAHIPGFYGKFIILTNGIYEETGFLGSQCVSPNPKSQIQNLKSH
jgi:hypothetical protein